MSTHSGRPVIRSETRAASEPSSDLLSDSETAERADIERDRRRQRELDDAEMGGEA
jgi:hypothetical protein